MLPTIVTRYNIDMRLDSEPNVQISKHNNTYSPDTYYADSRHDTAISFSPQNTDTPYIITNTGHTTGCTWIDLKHVGRILSCYHSPNTNRDEFAAFLDSLTAIIREAPAQSAIITGDFNAASPLWGSKWSNARGELLLEFIAANNLHVQNDGKIPTFCTHGRQSFIDLTLTTQIATDNIKNWKVLELEENLSDHHSIYFEIYPIDTLSPRHEHRQTNAPSRFRTKNLNMEIITQKFAQTLPAAQEMGAEELSAMVTSFCKNTLRTSGARKKKQAKYWWNSDIAEARSSCNKARRALTRQRAKLAHTTDAHIQLTLNTLEQEYQNLRKTLKRSIQESKRHQWRLLIEEVEKDPWGKPYAIVRHKIRPPAPSIDPEETENIIRKLFPSCSPLPARETHGTTPPQHIPTVTQEEVTLAGSRIATGKAPGPDTIPAEITKMIFTKFPELMRHVADQALRTGKFPDLWKNAHLVLIPKPGKPGAFRPICLLNTLAKGLEQIILNRLQTHAEIHNSLHNNQYGFRKHRSVITAIDKVLTKAHTVHQTSLRSRQFFILVLLDIKNAFNSIRFEVILDALRSKQFPPYLQNIIADYLRNRRIHRDGKEYQVTAGVPQGSILGPFLWNVAYDSLLALPDLPEGAELVAYADDLAVMVTAKHAHMLQNRTNITLHRIAQWMETHYLEVAPEKSEAILLIGKKRSPQINIQYNGHKIHIKKTVKYLGVILDQGLRGTAHVVAASAKALKAVNDVGRLMPRVGGPGEGKRKLLLSVAESILLFGSPVWAETALRIDRNKALIRRTQRVAAIRMTRAYRTVSTNASLVLAKSIPWDLQARERKHAYKDPAKDKNAIRQETIQLWQQEWNEIGRFAPGHWTRTLIPDIADWLISSYTYLTYYSTQILTGHGEFQAYLHKIGKAPSPMCVYCTSGLEDDVHHTLFECTAWDTHRHFTTDRRITDASTLIEHMLKNEENWSLGIKHIDSLMEYKTQTSKIRQENFERL